MFKTKTQYYYLEFDISEDIDKVKNIKVIILV